MLALRPGFASTFVLLVVVACGGSAASRSQGIHDAGSGDGGDASVPEGTGGGAGTGATANTGGMTTVGGAGGSSGGATATEAGIIGDGAGTTDGGLPASSCIGLVEDCGPNGDESCCMSPLVRGGTFYRSYDGVTTSPNNYTTKAYPATVSTFRLDRYEITVGRFRKFVAAYSQNMIAAGAGKNPNNANDPGWNEAWNVNLPSDAAALTIAVKCYSPAPAWTWTDGVGTNETRPMNCVDWYSAFAFCIWDGGRLPTEAEWNYAAAGGNEQRIYPWGKAPPDCSYANFGGANSPATACVLPGTGATNNVGSESPKGDGKWGQTDLAGNVAEWVLDSYANPYPQTPCLNCANMTVTSARVARGMGYTDFAQALLSSMRNLNTPSSPGYNLGVRCARNP